MREIVRIVIHYTASDDVDAKTIASWHKERFKGRNPDQSGNHIQYHKVVRKDGSVEQGRISSSIGWHTKGFNKESLGIVLTGSNDLSWYPSEEQYISLAREVNNWMTIFDVDITQVTTHGILHNGATSCPGRFDLKKLKDMIKELQQPEGEIMYSLVPSYSNAGTLVHYNNLWIGEGHPGIHEKDGVVFINITAKKDISSSVGDFNLNVYDYGGKNAWRAVDIKLEPGHGTDYVLKKGELGGKYWISFSSTTCEISVRQGFF